MVESGDWLTPRFNYENRWEKPVLYYWLTSATYLITGANEGAARLWSALSGVGLVLLTWAAARRSGSTEAAAWLAGAIVATCFGYVAEARLALPDLPLAFCITLGIWAALRASDDDRLAWWALTGVGAGLGLLMKGPVALVVPGLVLIPIWWRDWRTIRLRAAGIVTAALLCVAIAAPWYLAMWRTHGGEYLRFFFLENNVQRFATEEYNRSRSIAFYVPIVIGGFFPWSAYLVAVGIASAVGWLRTRARVSMADGRLLLWAAMPLLFYTVSVGKQPRYILPVLPPLAILLARSMTERVAAAQRGIRSRTLTIATWATAVSIAALLVLFARAQPLFITAYPQATSAALVVLTIAAAGVGWIAAKRAWGHLPGALALVSCALLLAIQFGALAGRRPEAVEQMAALVDAQRTADEPLGEYQVFVRNLVFYTGVKQQMLFDADGARAFLRSPRRVLLVVRREDLPDVQAPGVTLRTLGEVQYLNTANLRIGTVLAPDPRRDIDTVLLVTNR
jgi:4-amino-4-deoxy-L-arabinose transferase-like glycosyltransferase